MEDPSRSPLCLLLLYLSLTLSWTRELSHFSFYRASLSSSSLKELSLSFRSVLPFFLLFSTLGPSSEDGVPEARKQASWFFRSASLNPTRERIVDEEHSRAHWWRRLAKQRERGVLEFV